jgi:anti-sigma factor RsiW
VSQETGRQGRTEYALTEEDLHAYVDNRLGADRRAVIARYLEERRDVAQRIEAYCAQKEALRAAFALMAAEPIPPPLNFSRLIEARLARCRAPWWIAAAIGLALGAGGWLLHSGGVTSCRTYGSNQHHAVEQTQPNVTRPNVTRSAIMPPP